MRCFYINKQHLLINQQFYLSPFSSNLIMSLAMLLSFNKVQSPVSFFLSDWQIFCMIILLLQIKVFIRFEAGWSGLGLLTLEDGKQVRSTVQTHLSVDALYGHAGSVGASAESVHTRRLHPAAAQRKLLQTLCFCITPICTHHVTFNTQALYWDYLALKTRLIYLIHKDK